MEMRDFWVIIMDEIQGGKSVEVAFLTKSVTKMGTIRVNLESRAGVFHPQSGGANKNNPLQFVNHCYFALSQSNFVL